MYLSDRDIRKAVKSGDIIIEGFEEKRLQPSSYDVCLGNEFLIFEGHNLEVIDPKKDMSDSMRKITVEEKDGFFMLHPHQFALGVVEDYVGVNETLCCNLMGKSSIARLGLIIHTTAGFLDPGNALNLTLELVNASNYPLKLYPGMKIAQVAFCKLTSPAEKPYGQKDLNSKYLNSREVRPSRMFENFNK